MKILWALLTLSVAADLTIAEQIKCPNPVHCPCGSTDKNVTICTGDTDSKEIEPCRKWSKCKSCQEELNKCLQCEEGFEGPQCLIPKEQKVKSRLKRQNRQFHYHVFTRPQNLRNVRVQRQSQGLQRSSRYCPNLDSPKLGSIRCISNDQIRTCVGKCLPGYNFENRESDMEITLECRGGGGWSPLSSFPPCKSGGHCDLIVRGTGRFNCTTGMTGTWCDVHCDHRYIGRYFCYPGRSWDPSLPRCVRPKEVAAPQRPSCRCEFGASCDSRGNCVCPAGRTGTYCEIIVPEKQTCVDPGFISNGFRRHTDGSESHARRSFDEGHSLVYGCQSEFALQGSSLISCKNDGTWSTSLPRCIKQARVSPKPEILCPDPGQVANADRLNSDGRSSVGIQQYRVGQSVVYTCHPGFALQRRSLISCLASGSWSSRTPYCTRVFPPTPLPITTTKSSVKYCRDIGVDPNGSRKPRVPPNQRGFPQGSPVEFKCNPGFDLRGDRNIFCLISGEWSASRPRCVAQAPDPVVDTSDGPLAYCLNPGPIANGQVVYYPSINIRRRGEPEVNNMEPEYPENSRLQFSCNNGYSLEGNNVLICEDSGFWSDNVPTCIKDQVSYCPNPGPISNGRVQYYESINSRTVGEPSPEDNLAVDYPEGSRLQYSCDNRYTLEGSATLTCGTSGSWSANPPTCKRVGSSTTMYCSNPGAVYNGRIRIISPVVRPRTGAERLSEDDLEYPEGTRLVYTCDDGYDIRGASDTLRCESTGYWSSDPPTCAGDCGRSFMQTTRKIINGDKTSAGEWPWVVAISVQENNFSRLICGGAVVNGRTVLTAAHCLIGAGRFTLYFGKLHRENSKDDSEVLVRRSTRVILHPDFSNTTLDSDIGLVMFEPRIRFSVRVQPICLPTAESTARNLETGRIGYVTGWGYNERQLPSEELLLASLPVLSNEACKESYRRHNVALTVTRNMFCAGFDQGDQSACRGDSGSPLVFYDSLAARFTIEGLVSFGAERQCGQPGMYTIFTKVFRFLPWILRNL